MPPLMCVFALIALTQAQPSEPLRLVGTVALPQVEGRIDHLSIDVKGQRLFVAALGNNTIEVIDLKTGKQLYSIPGLHEPQGVVYVPNTNRLYAANGADGSLRIFDGIRACSLRRHAESACLRLTPHECQTRDLLLLSTQAWKKHTPAAPEVSAPVLFAGMEKTHACGTRASLTPDT